MSYLYLGDESIANMIKAMTTEQQEFALQQFSTKMLRAELHIRDVDMDNRLEQLSLLMGKYNETGIPDRETFEDFFNELAIIIKGGVMKMPEETKPTEEKPVEEVKESADETVQQNISESEVVEEVSDNKEEHIEESIQDTISDGESGV